MSRTRRTDVTNIKDPNANWFALRWPWEYHVWDRRKPWPTDLLIKYPIKIETIRVKAATEPKPDKVSYGKKKKMTLKCGCDVVRGFYNTSTKKSASFTLKPDSIVDFNKAMKVLCEIFSFSQWQVDNIMLYNPLVGITTEFKIFNPNGTKAALYTHRFIAENWEKLYTSIPLNVQFEVTGGFCDEKATCEKEKKEIEVVKCGEEHIKPKPIKSNKETVTLHLQ